MKLNELTIKEALLGLRRKDFSCEELVSQCLARIKEVEPKINAFITLCAEQALKQAKKMDENYPADLPLAGIPVGLKDVYSTKGVKTTAGSKVLENYVPVYDATVVEKLKQAGVIILGKTNCDAWAHGSSGENSDFGPTRNPWDITRTPGGSSSGSAAALAADTCLFTTGTDTGGSIRLPASFTNLVGLKPSYGRVSRYGIVAMASSFDAIGHFSKCVYDNALILGVTAGKDKYDATTSSVKVDHYMDFLDRRVKGVKIGLPIEYFTEAVDEKVRKKIEEAVLVWQNLGAKIVKVFLPRIKEALAVYYIIQPAEVSSNLARYDGIRYGKPRSFFGAEAKRRIMMGTYTLSSGYYEAYYVQAAKVRTLIKKDFEEVFAKVDLLVTPVSPTLPFKLGEKVASPLHMYLSDVLTVTANAAGICGLALPAGWVKNLPVGVQLLAPTMQEALLFQVGAAFEKETKFYERKPEL